MQPFEESDTKESLMDRHDRMERKTRYLRLKKRIQYRPRLYDLEQRINRATTGTELSQIALDTTLLEKDINRDWLREKNREREQDSIKRDFP